MQCQSSDSASTRCAAAPLTLTCQLLPQRHCCCHASVCWCMERPTLGSTQRRDVQNTQGLAPPPPLLLPAPLPNNVDTTHPEHIFSLNMALCPFVGLAHRRGYTLSFTQFSLQSYVLDAVSLVNE